MSRRRTYLDWNASAPLRREAREAMLAAMDIAGNPSSVHAEGRAARSIVERARGQVAQALGAGSADIVFTSGATEAAALALLGRDLAGAEIEHDSVRAWIRPDLTAEPSGRVPVDDPARSVLQAANSETGLLQDLPAGLAFSDMTQAFGKVPIAFDWSGVGMAAVSAHKIGGPRGVGALVLRAGSELAAQLRGGGQEMGRRAGTENVAGIAGFGAAAEAVMADLDANVWERVDKLRNILEEALQDHISHATFIGREGPRLPNTSCIAMPGWKGETQVMQMDLAGFAVSAGSACSSGKVRASRVVQAMGYPDALAQSAIRVSLGPETQEEDVLRFVEAWTRQAKRMQARAA